MKRVLTFDFGASSGRAIIASFDNGKMGLKEVHRFFNDPVMVNGFLYWDILRLYHEIKQGIIAAKLDGGFDSIGIDTWGVDYGLIDKDGNLMENPVHYRDTNAYGIEEDLHNVISKEDLYLKTGVQYQPFNSIYRIYNTVKNYKRKIDSCDKLLFIPDLFAYFLTGEKKTEKTFAMTTNLYNPITSDWDYEIIEKLGLPKNIFAPVIKPGEKYGMLKAEIAEELGCDVVPVIAVATHDTASAIAAVPSDKEDFVYISCGTWSLFGTELKNPILKLEAMESGFTNEGGYDDTIIFLKNIMGLWIFQETCRQWKREGKEFTYKILDKQANEAKRFNCFIDPASPEFSPYGNMPKRIKEYCEKTGQQVPKTDGEICRCIYESLAFKYRQSLEEIEKITGKKYDRIHMVGGGINNKLLCQFAADFCNVEVYAGPVEATAAGNALVQFISAGEISDFAEARRISAKNTDLAIYKPNQSEEIEKAYKEFLRIQYK
ncbi:MAG: rhamnulokinase [Clostridia bacterium]|nr:rhamnulokinase [Clostridia bacterium]